MQEVERVAAGREVSNLGLHHSLASICGRWRSPRSDCLPTRMDYTEEQAITSTRNPIDREGKRCILEEAGKMLTDITWTWTGRQILGKFPRTSSSFDDCI
jgi:hypothetical protein